MSGSRACECPGDGGAGPTDGHGGRWVGGEHREDERHFRRPDSAIYANIVAPEPPVLPPPYPTELHPLTLVKKKEKKPKRGRRRPT